MQLLPKELKAKIPPLYSQADTPDPLVICKFFTPDGGWTWWVLEYDQEDTFFGYVKGFEAELGYFSLSELEGIKGNLGLPVERDIWFMPTPLSEIRRENP